MGSRNFVVHVILRMVAIFLVKLMGFFVRIPLFRALGPEGIGLYQMVYAFYGLMLTLITGGIPTALALSTAGDKQHGNRMMRRFSGYFILFGLVFSLLCYLLSDKIAHFMGNRDLEFALRCTAPAIAIVPLLSLLRGYLQGNERHGILAVSELIEQAVRISVLLILVLLWVHYGVSYAVGGAMLGAFSGATLALFFVLVLLNRGTASPKRFVGHKGIPDEMSIFFYASLTISATRLLIPFSDFLDAIIVPKRIQASGLSLVEATSMYGEISGMGSLVVYMPSLLTSAIAFALSTRLTSNWRSNQITAYQKHSILALEIAALWGVGATLIMIFHATDLSLIFYSTTAASKSIQYLCLAPLLCGIREMSTIILWASGQKKAPLIGLVLGISGSVLCNYFLIAIPGLSYTGTAMGILVLEAIAATWNLYMIKKGFSLGLGSILMKCMALTIFVLAEIWLFRIIFSNGDHRSFLQSTGEMTLLFTTVFLYLMYRFNRSRDSIS
ncbi:oligosaccharide flippase family protein [Paenibacillus agricola]|uniref:Oligosaccharide flippase family protein n=1 Tax=Paenibacillus agricola TaxID=2716264 RepID=A0ABX0JCU5_9BACL|nr:oligosaccharide flippase family protein [Paenibacillus agricola]NHN31515.1 oligosaccharide flippase family protein [Paenibacillus agricola]